MSIKKNYLYNLIKIINQLLFPLLTIPYVSRILGAEGVGTVEYFLAITAYGLLVSNFGLYPYSSIEIAKQTDQLKLKKLIIVTFNFQLLTTILGSIVFVLLSFLLGITDTTLIAIFLFKILLNLFRVEWYFIGKENFKYITIRDLVVKILFLIIIFSFIKNPSDIYYYAIALVLGDGLANLFNIRKMLKELNIKIIELLKVSYVDLLLIFKDSLPFFFSSIAITIYITVDKIMLGRMIGVDSVGYYSMSDRLVRIAMGIALALATVITPRLAFHYHNDKEKYFSLLKQSSNFILMLTFPMFIGIFIMAEDIVLLVFGRDFLPAVLTLKILSSYTILVPFANILGLQVLNIAGEAKKYTISLIIATIINVILNIILITRFKQDGVAVASVIAEFIGISIQAYYVRKIFSLDKIFDKGILLYIIASILMGICMLLISILNLDLISRVILNIMVGIISYFTVLIILKEKMIIKYMNKLKGIKNL